MTLLVAFLLWSSAQAQPQAPAPAPSLIEQIACAPTGLPVPPLAGLRVLGGYVHGRIMFATGDAFIINAGTAQGVQKGQQYFVRRPIADPGTKQPKVGALYGVHTAGWATIVDVKETMAVAAVTHACDPIIEGDFLEPFVAPTIPTAALTGAPDYEHPGHIMMGDERRQMGYAGLTMLMDLGSEDGVRAGQVLTLYRETLNGQGPIIDLGRATVMGVTPQHSLIRIDSTREAIYIGDFVAIHRITQ